MSINQIPALLLDRAIVGTSGMTLYVAVGRIVGDEDDTVFVVRADTYAGAWETFEQELYEDADLQPEDAKELEADHGAAVVHTNIFTLGQIAE